MKYYFHSDLTDIILFIIFDSGVKILLIGYCCSHQLGVSNSKLYIYIMGKIKSSLPTPSLQYNLPTFYCGYFH